MIDACLSPENHLASCSRSSPCASCPVRSPAVFCSWRRRRSGRKLILRRTVSSSYSFSTDLRPGYAWQDLYFTRVSLRVWCGGNTSISASLFASRSCRSGWREGAKRTGKGGEAGGGAGQGESPDIASLLAGHRLDSFYFCFCKAWSARVSWQIIVHKSIPKQEVAVRVDSVLAMRITDRSVDSVGIVGRIELRIRSPALTLVFSSCELILLSFYPNPPSPFFCRSILFLKDQHVGQEGGLRNDLARDNSLLRRPETFQKSPGPFLSPSACGARYPRQWLYSCACRTWGMGVGWLLGQRQAGRQASWQAGNTVW